MPLARWIVSRINLAKTRSPDWHAFQSVRSKTLAKNKHCGNITLGKFAVVPLGQTLSEDYLLTIETYSLSNDDQQMAVDSLQKVSFDD
jgi:hypothetical protein